MKISKKLVLVILFIFSFIVIEARKKRKAEWNVKIEYENGVKVIKNPKKSYYGELILDLEESISVRGRKWPKGVLEEACKFPSHRPFFQKILVDEKQRIYLVRVVSVFEEGDKVVIDVFNKKGYYLHKIITSHKPEIIRNGYLYELYTSDESGEEKMRRYKIKNWEQIKTSP